MIAIPDIYKNNAIGTCQIIERGNRCHSFLQKDTFVMIEHTPKKQRVIVNKEFNDFLIEESKIIGIILKDKRLRPLGDTVLFERDMRQEVSESGIILNYDTSQNLTGWIRDFGVPTFGKKRKDRGININSYCQLDKWQETMKEFHYDGRNYLVVESKDVLFEWSN